MDEIAKRGNRMTESLRTKTLLVAITAATLMSTVIVAPRESFAQQYLAQGEVATMPRLNLTLEQKHVIRELIKDMKIEPAPAPARSAVGDPVAQDANLRPMPSDVGL